jgi:hypothetical protein
MTELDTRIDEIIKGLVRDVAAGVHGLYRGDTRQQTTQLKLGTYGREAADRIRAAIRGQLGTPAGGMTPPAADAPGAGLGGPPAPSFGAAAPAPFGGAAPAPAALSQEEIGAITRCVMAWLPMGGLPNAATPEMKCVAGAREMCPTWGDREAARLAVRRLASG